MKKNKKSDIVTHYQKLYKKYGLNPASLGWLKGKQEIRFKILTEIGNLENSSILDIGCGFGDLVAYLESEKIKAEYMGIHVMGDKKVALVLTTTFGDMSQISLQSLDDAFKDAIGFKFDVVELDSKILITGSGQSDSTAYFKVEDTRQGKMVGSTRYYFKE